MKNMLKKLLVIITLFGIASCAKKIGDMLPQRPSKSLRLDESASVEFKQGWTDGCEVGMSAGSNTFYKMFYRSNAVDGYKMTSSSDYKTAWGNAFWFCYRYDHLKQKSSVWGNVFQGVI